MRVHLDDDDPRAEPGGPFCGSLPHHPYPAMTTFLPATIRLVSSVSRPRRTVRSRICYRKGILLCASLTASIGKGSSPSSCIDFRRLMPVVVSSHPPSILGMRSLRFYYHRNDVSAVVDNYLRIPLEHLLYVLGILRGVMPLLLNTCMPSSTRAAHIASCVERGLLPAVTTVAPSLCMTLSRHAVFASRWRQHPITRPSSGLYFLPSRLSV